MLTHLKRLIQQNCPGFLLRPVYKLRSVLRYRQNLRAPCSTVFTEIYQNRGWSGDSISGNGSDTQQTESIRKSLPRLLEKYEIKTLLDLPCGDFQWMRQVNLGAVKYIGGDVVAELVERNNAQYRTDSCEFRVLDLTQDPLPRADMILCRDCFIHLSFRDVKAALHNIAQSGIPYLLTTHFPNVTLNFDIVTGDARGLNLQLPPFSFPKPMAVIADGSSATSDVSQVRELALWRVQDMGQS